MAILGFLTIALILFLILTKRASTLVALTVVPVLAALVGGAGLGIGGFITNGIKSVAPTAAMFVFAVLYFGLLSDAGMFAPMIKGILKTVGRDPVKIAIGTAVLAVLAHLDGSGATTFAIVIPAMLPIFTELQMDKRILVGVTALAAGTANMLPWGGPTIRAATAINVDVTTLFNPMAIPMAAGLLSVLAIAGYLGLKERKRLGVQAGSGSTGFEEKALTEEEAKVRRPKLVWFNALLTVVAIVTLVKGWLPPQAVFLLAFCVAIIVNYPNPKDQTARINAHAKNALLMASVLFAAGVFTGIMKESGMLEAMSLTIASAIPASMGRFFPLIIGVFAMPLSLLFDPDSFYFGIMPVLAHTAETFGVANIDLARAAITGQMTTGFPLSPLTPATLLLVGLAGVELGDHQKFTFKWAWLISIVMLLTAVAIGVIPL